MKHSEALIVTPCMAEDWLGHAVYEKQRRRAEWHVRRLAVEMERGRFIKGTQIHFGVLGLPRAEVGEGGEAHCWFDPRRREQGEGLGR